MQFVENSKILFIILMLHHLFFSLKYIKYTVVFAYPTEIMGFGNSFGFLITVYHI